MEQAATVKQDYYGEEFKAFTEKAMDILKRLRPLAIPGNNKYGGVFMSEQENVFSKCVSSGKKKYYMDVKKAKNGNLYLSVKEVTLGDAPDKNETRRILVFDSAFKDFVTAFDEAKKFIPFKESSRPMAEKAAF